MALPTVPVTSFGGDTSAQQEYLTALNQVMQSLQSQAEPNLFSLAGALGKPTPTGHWSEALASGASEYGRQQAEQQKLAPNIAQMRASIAGQKYEMQNDAKALTLIGNKLGLSPTETESALSQGAVNPSQISVLQEIYPAIAQLSPKRAEMVKQMFSMGVEGQKLNISQQTNQINAIKELKATPELLPFFKKQGFVPMDATLDQVITGQVPINLSGTAPPADLSGKPITLDDANKPATLDVSKIGNFLGSNLTVTSPYGMRIDPITKKETMHNGIDLAGKAGEPLKALFGGTVINASPVGQYGNTVVVQHDDGHHSYYAHLDKAGVKEGDVIKAGDIIGNLGSTGKSTGPHVEIGIKTPDRKSINPLDYPPLKNMFAPKPIAGGETLLASTSTNDRLPRESLEDYQNRKKAEAMSKIKVAEEEKLSKIRSGEEREKGVEKQPIASVDLITNLGDYKDVSYNRTQLNHVRGLIQKNPDVMDFMSQKGILSAIGSLIQSGIQTPWGSINAEINTALGKLNLTPEKQAVAREIAQIIYEQNQPIMKQGKSIFGPAISNIDIVNMAKPGFAPEDPSQYIINMTMKMELISEYNGILKKKLDTWLDNNPRANTRKFFSSEEYISTVNDFNKMYSNLLKGLNYGKK
jgi:murein DD-endopeptidase MepM/ murein hydrolase activator NlpD